MRLKSGAFIHLLLFTTCFSCQWGRDDINTSGITYEPQIRRFEIALQQAASDNFSPSALQQLKIVYPDLFPLYVNSIMRFGSPADSMSRATLKQFFADENIQGLFEDVLQKYPEGSLEVEEEQLREGLKRLKFYFPDRVLPSLNTMIAAFSYSTVCADSLLVIGLENYMGSDYKIYPQTGLPKYKFEHFSREFMVADALKAWLLTEFTQESGLTLLDQMVYHGKIIYLLSRLLPELDEHLWFGYLENEYEWCLENEEEIWFHFVDMELLYNRENHHIRKYMGDAPFIAGFPKGSPGRVGQFIGYRIVQSLMKDSEMTIPELMQLNDGKQVLLKSNYKPKR
jgi:hypothetical protein